MTLRGERVYTFLWYFWPCSIRALFLPDYWDTEQDSNVQISVLFCLLLFLFLHHWVLLTKFFVYLPHVLGSCNTANIFVSDLWAWRSKRHTFFILIMVRYSVSSHSVGAISTKFGVCVFFPHLFGSCNAQGSESSDLVTLSADASLARCQPSFLWSSKEATILVPDPAGLGQPVKRHESVWICDAVPSTFTTSTFDLKLLC